MTTEVEIGLYIFMLAAFLGYHLISRVPPLLHTPLMSATNAMSGISLIGSMLIAGAGYGTASTIFGFIAVTCSSTNVVGGFLITDRMLRMFRSEHDDRQRSGRASVLLKQSHWPVLVLLLLGLVLWSTKELLAANRPDFTQWLKFFYILSAALFILGLKGLSSPKHARRGMFLAEAGMLLAIVGTLFHHDIVNYRWISAGLGLGSVIGGSMGFWIPMTAVPQRTAFSHSLGALAATLIGISEYIRLGPGLGKLMTTTVGLQVVIGGLTFTGSLMAAGKLQGTLPAAPITYKGQNIFNTALLGVVIGLMIYLVFSPSTAAAFFTMVAFSLLFGFLLVIPIGAADIPVVI
jgi:NAD/NADP transhydrogenase beta subunit